jgi:hypothetical protein
MYFKQISTLPLAQSRQKIKKNKLKSKFSHAWCRCLINITTGKVLAHTQHAQKQNIRQKIFKIIVDFLFKCQSRESKSYIMSHLGTFTGKVA